MQWWALAAAQSGVISRPQLEAHGAHQRAVTRMLAGEYLRPLAAGVYIARGAPLTFQARLWAATLSTGGILGFSTSAELWGVTDEHDDLVHVVLPHSRRVYPPEWVRVHRVPVPSRQVVQREDLAVTANGWTLFDYLPTLSSSQAIRLADRALQRRWITPDDIAGRLRDFPRRRGNRMLRAVLAITSDGAAAESERRLHQVLRGAGVHGWTPNYAVWVDGELVAVLDLAIPHRRVAIEVDGMAYHVDADRFQRDRARQNDLVMLGWTVLRFTWADITDLPQRIIAAIRSVAGS
jgi:very-short-patch-repair endonuclease